MKLTDKYVFFNGGVLSNWYMLKFIVDKIQYNCGEQYMMAQKAILFGDYLTLDKIMNSSDPKEIKSFGREIKNYDDNLWSSNRYDIVKPGLYEKFNQNKYLKDFILVFGKRIFVEASINDNIWGIGMNENDPLIDNPENWKGENLLGKILSEIRDEIEKNNI